MFSLPRLDAVDSQDETDDEKTNTADNTPTRTKHGVHFETVLLACQIITGNEFDTAYLSYDRPGHDRVHISRQGILMRNYYYLQVPQGAYPYDRLNLILHHLSFRIMLINQTIRRRQ